MSTCKLCGGPKQDWQVYCGAACCVAWENGIRTKEQLERILQPLQTLREGPLNGQEDPKVIEG